jgi:hypothetical protein
VFDQRPKIVVYLDDRARSRGDTREHVSALLRNRARDGGALHLTLRVDNHARVVLEVDEGSVLSPPRLALADQHTRHDCACTTHPSGQHAAHTQAAAPTANRLQRLHPSTASTARSKSGSDAPFFRRSGLPFFTVQMHMSPGDAAGSLLRRPLTPATAMMYRFLAPASAESHALSVAGPSRASKPPVRLTACLLRFALCGRGCGCGALRLGCAGSGTS